MIHKYIEPIVKPIAKGLAKGLASIVLLSSLSGCCAIVFAPPIILGMLGDAERDSHKKDEYRLFKYEVLGGMYMGGGPGTPRTSPNQDSNIPAYAPNSR